MLETINAKQLNLSVSGTLRKKALKINQINEIQKIYKYTRK
jgi:hypothetical protein